MPKEYPRVARINTQVQRELAEIIRDELRDPRVRGVTLTSVEVSPDMRHAKIHVSVLALDGKPAEAAKALNGAAPVGPLPLPAGVIKSDGVVEVGVDFQHGRLPIGAPGPDYSTLDALRVKGAIEIETARETRLLDLTTVETTVKYAGYLKRQENEIARLRREEHRAIPAGFPFRRVPGLSTEIVQRLEQVRPDTLAHALRIPGVTPAAVAVLGAYISKLGHITETLGSKV